jgi:hypothetical protein
MSYIVCQFRIMLAANSQKRYKSPIMMHIRHLLSLVKRRMLYAGASAALFMISSCNSGINELGVAGQPISFSSHTDGETPRATPTTALTLRRMGVFG